MKSYSSKKLIKILKLHGWRLVGVDGNHQQYKHPGKSGKITLTHPEKNIPNETLKNISKQSGLQFD